MLDKIFGYDVIKEFKDSGQKKVYEIDHPQYGDCMLKYGKCFSGSSLERIKREVDILKQINSKYYPKNYDFAYKDSGEFIILEEYVKSRALSECICEYIANEKKVLELSLEVIEGLNIIWDKKIVHRDLKPDNILITEDGQPVIIDLGIARVLDEKSLTLTIQQSGPCTPIYASPEQIANNKKIIDKRSDFYSLGIIIAELILGKHPFSVDIVGGMSIYDNLIHNRYSLSYKDIKISNELSRLLNKLLEVEPYKRIRTSKQFYEYILSILK